MVLPRFQRFVICGVGLLGGSLGMALRRRGMAARIVGLGRSAERLEHARQMGAIDEGTTRAAEALAGADGLVMAIPPRQIRERWEELVPLIEQGTFVTDVGSVKAKIVEEAERVLPRAVRFIGSHPMAGSEKTGVSHARSDFYDSSACILTPTAQTPPETVALAVRFWRALGARVVIASPERHDQLLAGVSHLPHLLAAALMQTLGRRLDSPGLMAAIAGPGLRDSTRIAAADPEIWRQIFSENAPAILDCLDQFQGVLDQWRTALARPTPDLKALGNYYAEGREARQGLDATLETEG